MLKRLSLLLAGLLLFAACSDGPRPVDIGSEECAHCRMIVSEEAFAAQLRTQQGRTLVFDSVECLADFVVQAEADGDTDVGGMWVTDFNAPGSWVEAREAAYLQSPNLRSPMGMNLSAYASPADAEAAFDEHGGEVLDWNQVRALMGDRMPMEGHHAH